MALQSPEPGTDPPTDQVSNQASLPGMREQQGKGESADRMLAVGEEANPAIGSVSLSFELYSYSVRMSMLGV